MNMWYFRFPNLRYEDEDLQFENNVLYFINVLYRSAQTIAHYIQERDDPEEIDELQGTLGTILHGVMHILYHPLLIILKDSINVWKGGAQTDDAKKEIRCRLEYLKDCADWSKREELEHNEILPTLEGAKVKALREASRKVEAMGEHASESDEFRDFMDMVKKIKHKDLCHKLNLFQIIPFLHESKSVKNSSHSAIRRNRNFLHRQIPYTQIH